MMGQANYLENNVVRTPFELEFDVRKEMPTVSFENPELQQILRYSRKTLSPFTTNSSPRRTSGTLESHTGNSATPSTWANTNSKNFR
jgi:hypothetical protein